MNQQNNNIPVLLLRNSCVVRQYTWVGWSQAEVRSSQMAEVLDAIWNCKAVTII